jgi:hypothetical protein
MERQKLTVDTSVYVIIADINKEPGEKLAKDLNDEGHQ